MRNLIGTALIGMSLAAGAVVFVGGLSTAQSGPTTATTGQTVAGENTVTLQVGNLWCASCKYIVQRVLEDQPGVIKAQVLYDEKRAVVTFDPARINAQSLVRATNEIGFPSSVLKD